MIECYLALGSNLKSPYRQLKGAIKSLRNLPQTYLLQTTFFYANPAQGRKTQPDFLNTVVKIHTRLTPVNLLRECQKIEKKQGRIRHIKWGARTLDVDILLYGCRQINTPLLQIPHPYILQRDFVLIPLYAILHGHHLKFLDEAIFVPEETGAEFRFL